MSALGQKQTFALQNAMSALLPIVDIPSCPNNVRKGPIADMTAATTRAGRSRCPVCRGHLLTNAVMLLRHGLFYADRLMMRLCITMVARVAEPAMESTVVLGQLIRPTTMVNHLGPGVNVGLRLDVGVDVCLRDRATGLRRGPGLDREGRSHQAQHGCSGKSESKFSHWYSPWVIVGEQSLAGL